jgi:hypothetical protein
MTEPGATPEEVRARIRAAFELLQKARLNPEQQVALGWLSGTALTLVELAEPTWSERLLGNLGILPRP